MPVGLIDQCLRASLIDDDKGLKPLAPMMTGAWQVP